MKRYTNILYWIAMAGLLAYFAYSKGWILANFESIAPKQAHTLLEKDNNVTLLDVRTDGEFKQEHIQGAKLIPLQILSENLLSLQNDRNKKIIVYCQSGNRSVSASRILEKHGFTPLNVKGGIGAWKREGLSVVK
ncbi:MAG: rhodanese-like domain-containing protein [Campylobacterota bacterium]|nr:rhodanese-like domain-containing protein [Campylobacterota bacterium]